MTCDNVTSANNLFAIGNSERGSQAIGERQLPKGSISLLVDHSDVSLLSEARLSHPHEVSMRFAISILLLYTFCPLALCQVREGPCPVVEVSDGDTITVLRAGIKESVRLLYVDAPETHNNGHDRERPEGQLAKDAVIKWLPVGTDVWLWGPHDQLKRDRYHRLLAVILTDKEAEDSIQGRLMDEGWSPVWRKWIRGKADMPEWLSVEYDKRVSVAKSNMRGVWASDLAYMEMVSAETGGSPSRLKMEEDHDGQQEEDMPITARLTPLEVKHLELDQEKAVAAFRKEESIYKSTINRIEAERQAILEGQLSKDSLPQRYATARERWIAMEAIARERVEKAKAKVDDLRVLLGGAPAGTP